LTSTVLQSILDGLTDVTMPQLANERPSKEFVTAEGCVLRVHAPRCSSLAAGAAGLRAAVELKRRDVDAIIASQSAFGVLGLGEVTLRTAKSAG
jgi:hypothetical protein